MLQHGIVPDDDHQSISRESLADSTAGRLGRQGDAEASYTEALSIYQRLDPPKRGFFQTEINRKGFEILISAVAAPDRQPAGGADDARVKDLRNGSTAGQYQEAETRCQSVGRSDYAVSEANRIRAQQWFAGRGT